jgi:hypothetical protein
MNSGKVSLFTFPFCASSFPPALKSDLRAKVSKFWILTSVEIWTANCVSVDAPYSFSIFVLAMAKHDSKFSCLRGHFAGFPGEIWYSAVKFAFVKICCVDA